MGVLRFPRKGADFRGQEIAAGAYTLRYGDQPVDGNHVGTFDTRDFLLLLPAGADESPAALAEADLFEKSAQAAGSTHPAILPLVKPAGDGAKPTLRHIEEKEWWTCASAVRTPAARSGARADRGGEGRRVNGFPEKGGLHAVANSLGRRLRQDGRS